MNSTNQIAFFWMGECIDIPQMLVESIRLTCNPNTKIIQLSDTKTPDVYDVDLCIHSELPKDIMLARLAAYSTLELDNHYTFFCDADSLFINDLTLTGNEEILLAKRKVDGLINCNYPEHYPEFINKYLSEVMPFLFGAIAVRRNNVFFNKLLHRCKSLPPRFHRWYGDQYSLNQEFIQGDKSQFGNLDVDIHLCIIKDTPSSEELNKLRLAGTQMITFKGPSAKKNIPDTLRLLKESLCKF